VSQENDYYLNDPLRLAIISYITSNPNSTIREIFEGLPASHTKVKHWLAQLTLSGTVTPSSPIRSVPLQSITWSIAGGGGGGGPAVGDGLLLENGTDFVLLETGDFVLLE